MTQARILKPASRQYRGTRTDPARWSVWQPRPGDVLVCTPSKCGTTWTQSILTMLAHGGPDLPDKVPVLSPWVDADLGVSAEAVAEALDRQTGRRVVKTHTPADGFPVWEGVTVIAVYRHPLDAFMSMQKHIQNVAQLRVTALATKTLDQALDAFVNTPEATDDIDNDSLSHMVLHLRETVLSGRLPDLGVFHYADMVADNRRAVEGLARAAGFDVSDAVIDAVTEATRFDTMRANALNFAPVAGTGFWKSDAGFFDSASSRKWEGKLSDAQIAHYTDRLAAILPDERQRAWLEYGDGAGRPFAA